MPGIDTLALGGRGLAMASLAFAGAMAAVMPRPVATGGLSHNDLAAIRIVKMASSPSAAPRVLDERPARLKRVAKRDGSEPQRELRARSPRI